MVWYLHLIKNIPQFVVIRTVKGFSLVNEVEVDVFLKFPCFFNDPTYVANLISGSSAFSQSSLYIWKFLVHVLLKPSLKDFEHNLAGVDERRMLILSGWAVWHVLGGVNTDGSLMPSCMSKNRVDNITL